MILDKKMADSVIEELRPIIDFDINLIDNDGLIISSTDKNRENTLHSGALRLMNENLNKLIIYSDDEYKGCKSGVNLPIEIEDQRVAIIGITGDPASTLKYCNIVKKMTELLVQYNIEYNHNISKTKADLLLANSLILGNFNAFTDNIEGQLLQSGLKIEGPFCVAILKIVGLEDHSDRKSIVLETDAEEYLIKNLNSKRILCTENENMFIAISNTDSNKLCSILEKLKSTMESTYRQTLFCHVGSDRPDYREIYKSYNEAMLLSNYTPSDNPDIYRFSSANLSIAIEQIPNNTKKLIFDSVFKECDKKEIRDFCSFIITFFEHNGSLIKIAKQTFQHKNTVQYKIKKIYDKTNLDIRYYRDMFVLFISASYYLENY